MVPHLSLQRSGSVKDPATKPMFKTQKTTTSLRDKRVPETDECYKIGHGFNKIILPLRQVICITKDSYC